MRRKLKGILLAAVMIGAACAAWPGAVKEIDSAMVFFSTSRLFSDYLVLKCALAPGK